MRKKIKNIFLTGIAAIIPIGVTLYILFFIMGMMNKLVQLIPAKYHPDQLFSFHIPGLGIIVMVVLIFIIGLVTRSYLGNKLVGWGELFVGKIPVVRTIYTAIKQLVDAIFSEKSGSFKRVVLIEYPRKGLYSVAFVTGEAKGEVQTKTSQRCLNLFVPTTPNPTSGFYIMIPETDVVNLDMTIDEAFTLIISGGIYTPQEVEKNSEKEKMHADNF